MAEVDRLLTAATVTLDTVDPDHPDAQHCLWSYFAELQARFDTGFDPARSLLPDAGELRPPHGLFLLARLHAEPIGCAGLKLPPGVPAEIKRVWVAPHDRGLGLGRRFLADLEARAVQHGREVLRLDTNRALGVAIRPVPLLRLPGGPGLQRRAVRPPLVREADHRTVVGVRVPAN
ncbi:N-acetylglutamate synthase and related acetyltransferases [Streptomyces sp. SceaMP-e96]|nr:N-acetylglutamate synthase and related acetyltransferases [Streptomyces sp. SceaMP-e96]